eukprot:1193033-Prorocentrum_minimum.AAC.3
MLGAQPQLSRISPASARQPLSQLSAACAPIGRRKAGQNGESKGETQQKREGTLKRQMAVDDFEGKGRGGRASTAECNEKDCQAVPFMRTT